MTKGTDLRRRALCALALLTVVGSVGAGAAEAQSFYGRGGYDRAAYQELGRGGYDGGSRRDYGDGYRGGYGRGAVLPRDYRSREVADPGRYHLRRPPSGYGWVGDERNAYLVQRSTGMVLDAVPGAYDPPPEYRGRRGRR